MLAAKRLPDVLKCVLNDGVEGAVLMTVEGSILAHEFITYPGNINETSLAAISSSIWNNYAQAGVELSHHVMKFENGSIAIASIGKAHLLVAFGTDVSIGLLKGRVEALCNYFNRIFEQLK